MTTKIGVIVGMENDFPEAFCARMNAIPGFSADFVKLGGIRDDMPMDCRVLIDRISHEVPFFRFYLKAAALAGSYVINDPFWWSADEKFFGFSLAKKLGLVVPHTVMLPQHSYIPDIDPNRSLRNLQYPLDWDAIIDYVGFPAILKPADGGGWKHVYRVDSRDELIWRYDQTGTLVMTLQQFVNFDDYVRCICIGREQIRPIRYDPQNRRYLPDEGFLSPSLQAQVVDGALALNQSLGYDMNSVEFAIEDGVPYAIDFTNPAPDMYRSSILEPNFEWCMDKMVELVTGIVRENRTMGTSYSFERYLAARPGGTKP